ncbi:MAG: DNA-protecting protein DprA [Turicibacter sp.]|nr:DNA-protecting protein DprA [Turicibacter sp.]
MDKRQKLIALSHELEGDWLGMYEILKRDCYLKFYEPADVPETAAAVTIYDGDYPQMLLGLRMPPFVLYYQGDLQLLGEGLSAVLGSYAPSSYCRRMLQGFLLGKTSCAVMDQGVSERALRDKAVGIAACGLREASTVIMDNLEPAGLAISEFPPNTPFSPRRYFRANRMMLEVSEAAYLFELPPRDSRLGAVEGSLNEGVAVFVLADQLDSPVSKGGLSLLDEGAQVMCRNLFSN